MLSGKKTKYGYDIVYRIDGKQFSFLDILFILDLMFQNEDRIYPPSKGFKGRQMLVDAINDVANGMNWKTLCKKYKLNPKSLSVVL